MPVTDKINWSLLHEQKLVLLELIQGLNDSTAAIEGCIGDISIGGKVQKELDQDKIQDTINGIINLIDALEDEAIANGVIE